jgi:PKD repeat protein
LPKEDRIAGLPKDWQSGVFLFHGPAHFEEAPDRAMKFRQRTLLWPLLLLSWSLSDTVFSTPLAWASHEGFYTMELLSKEPLVVGERMNDFSWAELEPSPGTYNWGTETTGLRGAIKRAFQAGKVVRIGIEAGADAPPWLTDPAGAFRVPTYAVLTSHDTTYNAPYVWHPTYLERLVQFMTALGAYLDSPAFPYRSAIAGIYVSAGPKFVEMITAGGSEAFRNARLLTPPYTKAGYRDAWFTTLDATLAAFPTVRVIMNLSQTWDEVASPNTGHPMNDWVARQVGEYARNLAPSRIEFQNASIPNTFFGLVPYLRAKASEGIAISAQVDWYRLTREMSTGGTAVTQQELCESYAYAYTLGARKIEVNKLAFTTPSLRQVTQVWDPAFKGTAAPPDCAQWEPLPPDTTAPTVPTGLSGVVDSPTQITLTWSPSTDNVGVAGYKLYRDDVLSAEVTATSFTDTTVLPQTTYAYRASAVDAAGNESARSAPVPVTTPPFNHAPVLDPIGEQTIAEGEAFSLTITATDPDGDLLTYSVSPLPPGATFTGQTLSWTPDFAQAGSYSVTFTVSDGSLLDSEAITIDVLNTNRPPVFTSVSSKTIPEGELLMFSVGATDPDGQGLTLSAEQANGDPLGVLGATFADRGDGSGIFTWQPSFIQAGEYLILFTASDGELTSTELIAITVTNTNRPPVLGPIADRTVNEGETVTFSPLATDPDGDALTLGYSGWMTGASYTTTYEDAGTHTVTVTVSDGILTDAQTVTVMVLNVNRPPLFGLLSDQVVNEGELLQFSVSGTDRDGDPLALWARVADGQFLSTIGATLESISEVPGRIEKVFRWTPTFTQAGTYEVAFRLRDGQVTVSSRIRIVARDVPLQIISLIDSPDPFTANGDGLTDTTTISATFNQPVTSWTLTITNDAGATVKTFAYSGTGTTALTQSWDGRWTSGARVAKGKTFTYTLSATAPNGGGSASQSGTITVR